MQHVYFQVCKIKMCLFYRFLLFAYWMADVKETQGCYDQRKNGGHERHGSGSSRQVSKTVSTIFSTFHNNTMKAFSSNL